MISRSRAVGREHADTLKNIEDSFRDTILHPAELVIQVMLGHPACRARGG